MPWKIVKRDDEYCVVKESDGSTVACHDTRAKAKRQLAALYASEKNMFLVEKQADGVYRWFSVWTNKYRDRDYPVPEILSSDAHIDFAKAVNDGDWPYPELWLWHYPKRIGVSDLIGYDKDSGFSIASGAFDKSMELIAESLALSDIELGTSHGMPIEEIRRDKDDPTIIVRYRSKEISPLPARVAANELTGFTLGGNMDLSPKGLGAKLSEMFGSEKAEEIAELLEGAATEAKEADLEFKETEEATDEEDETKDEAKSEAETKDESPLVATVENLDEMKLEVVKAMELSAEMATASTEVVIKELQDQNAALEQRIADLERSDEKKITELADETPRMSIAELYASRAVGRTKARVDGRESLAKDKPKETVDTRGMTTAQTVVSNIVSGHKED